MITSSNVQWSCHTQRPSQWSHFDASPGTNRLQDMMTSSSGNIFRVTSPLCGEFTGDQWIIHTKASCAELWCFLWISPWINGWVNSREAGVLRSYRCHYDVIVMDQYCQGHVSHSFISIKPQRHPSPLLYTLAYSQHASSAYWNSWQKKYDY